MSQLIAFQKIEFHINTMRVNLDDENCFVFFKFCFLLAQGINIEYKNLKHNQNELDDFLSIFFHTWNATKERVIRIQCCQIVHE